MLRREFLSWSAASAVPIKDTKPVYKLSEAVEILRACLAADHDIGNFEIHINDRSSAALVVVAFRSASPGLSEQDRNNL